MKTAVVTGAAGFLGTALTKKLIEHGYFVYAVVRPGGEHNSRLSGLYENVYVIECDISSYPKLSTLVQHIDGGLFFHLAITGKHVKDEQDKNIKYSLDAVRQAYELGCKRFIATGSQAEYGAIAPNVMQVEEMECRPITAYGEAKVRACEESKAIANELGIEWVWARIFSLIGRYEPKMRMLPSLYMALELGQDFLMSSGRQNWDYLDVNDAADAIIALAEKGQDGEIYNVASGAYRPLMEYTEELRHIIGGKGKIIYGDDTEPFISLQPSVEKINRDTGWKAKRSFFDSIKDYEII